MESSEFTNPLFFSISSTFDLTNFSKSWLFSIAANSVRPFPLLPIRTLFCLMSETATLTFLPFPKSDLEFETNGFKVTFCGKYVHEV